MTEANAIDTQTAAPTHGVDDIEYQVLEWKVLREEMETTLKAADKDVAERTHIAHVHGRTQQQVEAVLKRVAESPRHHATIGQASGLTGLALAAFNGIQAAQQIAEIDARIDELEVELAAAKDAAAKAASAKKKG